MATRLAQANSQTLTLFNYFRIGVLVEPQISSLIVLRHHT